MTSAGQPIPWPRPKAGDVRAVRFGVFEMDLRSGEVRKAGVLVKLAPQPFRVLSLLVLRRSEVVTREEFQQELWHDGTVVDFGQRLNTCIKQVRSVLGDDADAPRYVETLPRRGYRWIGPAEAVATVALHPARERLMDTAPAPRAPLPAPRTWRLRVQAAATLAAVVLAGQLLDPRPAAAPLPVWKRLAFPPGSLGAARFAPDGGILPGAPGQDGPRISPDGRYLALLERPVVGDERGRVVVLARNGTKTVLTPEWPRAEGLAWSPRGDEVWFTASLPGHDTAALYAASPSGRLRTILAGSGWLVLHDVCRDGRVLLARTRRPEPASGRLSELYVVEGLR